MMLGHEHQVLCPGRLRRFNPLVGIEFRGIEYGRINLSTAPFLAGKSVGAKVDDDAEFEILPFNLLRTGSEVGKILARQSPGKHEAHKGRYRKGRKRSHNPAASHWRGHSVLRGKIRRGELMSISHAGSYITKLARRENSACQSAAFTVLEAPVQRAGAQHGWRGESRPQCPFPARR